MQRRSFITLLGGAAAPAILWPLAARAQQGGRMRRVGWLTGAAENDLGARTNRAALQDALAKLGWIDGRNLKIELRFGAGDQDRIQGYAAELVGLAPDVIITAVGSATRAVQQHTHTIPIIFTSGGDPVATGLVRNIARPEGNVTGFSSFEPSIAGKWLELLKEATPRLIRAAILFNPDIPISAFYSASIEAAAAAMAVQAIQHSTRSAIDLVRVIDAFAAQPNGGLIVLPPTPTTAIRDMILQLAAQHRLPAIYSSLDSAAAGGLMSYAPNQADQARRAATYVDRILRGAKVTELPVQFPTKFELVVNLKAAKAIGFTMPEALLLRADELIQ